jgi:hypothetical protein
MKENAQIKIHFMDGTETMFQYPRLSGEDPSNLSLMRKSLETDRIVAHTSTGIVIVPLQNVKYLQVSPGPDKLPDNKLVLKDARIVEQNKIKDEGLSSCFIKVESKTL